MLNKTLVGVLAVTVWLANPMLGCNGSEEEEAEFAFSEVEMRAAVKGTYVGQLPATGETITIELDEAMVAPGGTTSTQSTKRVQCGSRSFVLTAEACASRSEMLLQGNVTSSGTAVASGALQKGSFVINSRLLDYGQLSLTLPDGSSITATYRDSEGLKDWRHTTADGRTQPLELAPGG